ncbi:hypothetical protein EWM64_g515 [Hericium alpestre]|uniref:AB hydrolase-1 domain-containing protein n=1 Tax=Hericium alpestre TaxID=135208 RepID=A0A4Z0A8W2_9AGAM|nr:hypothetical protein EWM64_g515 [Hericium alpestre]
MPPESLRKLGALAYSDTGAPPESTNYTTIVTVHGLTWKTGVFDPLQTYAHKHNTRVVCISRRDYPGADPLTEEDKHLLDGGKSVEEGQKDVFTFVEGRTDEMQDFLRLLIEQEGIQPVQDNTGGIIFIGWSLAALFAIGMLANPGRPAGRGLRPYIRRIIIFGACTEPELAIQQTERMDPTLLHTRLMTPPGVDPAEEYHLLLSRYYQHGDSLSTIGLAREEVPGSSATLARMSRADIAAVLDTKGGRTGSDFALIEQGFKYGFYQAFREKAFHPPTAADQLTDEPDQADPYDEWWDVPVRFLACQHSIFEIVLAYWVLQDEVATAKRMGRSMRRIDFRLMRGVNHFAHWDFPERTLLAFLAEDGVEV